MQSRVVSALFRCLIMLSCGVSALNQRQLSVMCFHYGVACNLQQVRLMQVA